MLLAYIVKVFPKQSTVILSSRPDRFYRALWFSLSFGGLPRWLPYLITKQNYIRLIRLRRLRRKYTSISSLRLYHTILSLKSILHNLWVIDQRGRRVFETLGDSIYFQFFTWSLYSCTIINKGLLNLIDTYIVILYVLLSPPSFDQF